MRLQTLDKSLRRTLHNQLVAIGKKIFPSNAADPKLLPRRPGPSGTPELL